eukprot:14199971-Alexandrium_andersonii.AAC.1
MAGPRGPDCTSASRRRPVLLWCMTGRAVARLHGLRPSQPLTAWRPCGKGWLRGAPVPLGALCP